MPYDEDKENKYLKYYFVKWQTYGFDCQVQFDDPFEISIDYPRDLLAMIIKMPLTFVSDEGYVPPENAVLFIEIPPQIPPEDQALLDFFTSLFASGMVSHLILGVSLQFLWSFIHNTQIIAYLGIMEQSIPANLKAFMLSLLQLITLDVIEMEKIISFVEYEFDEDYLSMNFLNSGYGTINILKNLGLTYMMIALVPIVYILYLPLQFF